MPCISIQQKQLNCLLGNERSDDADHCVLDDTELALVQHGQSIAATRQTTEPLNVLIGLLYLLEAVYFISATRKNK